MAALRVAALDELPTLGVALGARAGVPALGKAHLGEARVLALEQDAVLALQLLDPLGAVEHLLRLLGVKLFELRDVRAVGLEPRGHLDQAAVQLGAARLRVRRPLERRVELLLQRSRARAPVARATLERLLLAQRLGKQPLGLLGRQPRLRRRLLVARAALRERLLARGARGARGGRLLGLTPRLLQLSLERRAVRARRVRHAARLLERLRRAIQPAAQARLLVVGRARHPPLLFRLGAQRLERGLGGRRLLQRLLLLVGQVLQRALRAREGRLRRRRVVPDGARVGFVRVDLRLPHACHALGHRERRLRRLALGDRRAAQRRRFGRLHPRLLRLLPARL